jgi:hypothetical protein
MAISQGENMVHADDSVSHAGRLASFPDTGLIEVSFTPQPGGLFAEVSLKNVYDAAYLFGEDSLHLFMTVDKSGGNYLKLVEYASQHSQVTLAPAAIQFDAGYSLVFNHPDHGRILAGLKSGWLLGCIGYSPIFQDFVGQWVGKEEEASPQNNQ